MVSEEQRRPHVRELAVAGDFALVGGFSAFLVGRILSGYPGGLERLLCAVGNPARALRRRAESRRRARLRRHGLAA
jgi:hypothetical protein